MPSLLLTQCLQDDFVRPIGPQDPLPNHLHVGAAEALRLLGERPAEGPVARVMAWAYATSDDELRVVHIRDSHDPSDPGQAAHLERFGLHCVRGTPGAAFAFPAEAPPHKDVRVVDSLTLNDFQDTGLSELLAPWSSAPLRVGLVGVWTEAKITYLAYELRTRYPAWDLAVCSALTASSSRQHHFAALDHLDRILGVRVIDSVGAFVDFLGGAAADAPLVGLAAHPRLHLDGLTLGERDQTLVRYLFRDCREVRLTPLSGGYSGNIVARARSVDLHGHAQVPHVVKLGPMELMGRERTAFERIQEVLGNAAPHISDHADLHDRGALKYRYASMGGAPRTFQQLVMDGMPLDEVERVLDTVFGEQLGRLYQARGLESVDLLDHYAFSPRWAASVRLKVEALVGPAGDTVEVLPGRPVTNVCRFYEDVLPSLPRRAPDTVWMATVHGDLNGANILLDGHRNVWIIDFFHTRRAHAIMDLIKLESDLLYLFTPVPDAAALAHSLALTDALLQVSDLAAPLPAPPPGLPPSHARAWAIVRRLRAHVSRLVEASRDPLQLWIGLLRYAAHTLSFDEATELQRRWALYTAGRLTDLVSERLTQSTELYIDWVSQGAHGRPGALGLTILPGREDRRRDLHADVGVLLREGVRRVVCLVPTDELTWYGVPELLDVYREAGLTVLHTPIPDQLAGTPESLRHTVAWIDAGLSAGERVLVHCVGGLGRSGMVAAAWLRTRGLTADAAIAEVRRVRSPRAVETAAQEALVHAFTASPGGTP